MASDRPIFVVGCPRSGTTLLSTILHSHPRIAMPPETRFLLPVYYNRDRFGDLTDRANRRRLARAITVPRRKFGDLGLPRDKIVKAIVASPPTIGSALGTVWREFARSHGKGRWGEKRPGYCLYLDVVLRLFPDAQIIHLIRDPRSCVASLKEVGWWKGSSASAAALWTLIERERRRAVATLPRDTHFSVRYEDIIAEPEKTIRRLCDFLGEDFDAAMLDHTAAAQHIVPARKRWHDRSRQPLDAERVDAWHYRLTAREIGLIEFVARSGLRGNGYERSGAGTRPGAGDLLDYYNASARRRAAIVKRRALDRWQQRHEAGPVAWRR